MNEKLVPKRRFKGFTDDWEQSMFSDVLDFSISNNTLSRAGLNYDEGEVKNIHYGDILVKFDSIVDVNSDNVPWVTDGKPEDYKRQWLQNGDVIIADTAEDETTGKAIEVTGITDNYAVSGLHTMVARPNQEFAPKYLGYYLNSPAYHNTLLPLMQGIKVLSLSKANIAKTNVAFPKDVEEQAKIGSFFENIDNLIAFHQRKLNKTKAMKSAYLSEMFPTVGERKPKRRFAGFTDDWELRRLEGISDIVGGGTPSTSVEEYWGGDIDWYSPVEIGEQIYVSGSQKKITELGLQKSSARILPVGTVLFTSRAGIGNTAILAKEGSTNQGFQSIVPHENELDSYFIFSRTHELKRYGETNGAGSTFVEVSGKQMAKMPLLVPKLDEQHKIGEFFANLDKLIASQQQKLDKLQNMKKAYLNEMFI